MEAAPLRCFQTWSLRACPSSPIPYPNLRRLNRAPTPRLDTEGTRVTSGLTLDRMTGSVWTERKNGKARLRTVTVVWNRREVPLCAWLM